MRKVLTADKFDNPNEHGHEHMRSCGDPHTDTVPLLRGCYAHADYEERQERDGPYLQGQGEEPDEHSEPGLVLAEDAHGQDLEAVPGHREDGVGEERPRLAEVPHALLEVGADVLHLCNPAARLKLRTWKAERERW